MSASGLAEFSASSLILCEGKGDVGFYDKLLTLHGIRQLFDVRTPTNPGNSGYGPFLAIVRDTSPSFRANVKSVLIVSDNDDEPEKSFTDIQEQLKATNGFPVPAAERSVAKANGYPSVVILMIPHGEKGNLETLCVRAADEKWKLKKPIEDLLSQTPARDWSVGKQSKMLMQCTLASTCKNQPDITLAGHWGQKPEFHVPIDSAHFADIATFLKGFDGLINSAVA